MNVLGIETSCDDCSCGVIEDGYLKANVVHTQVIHKQFGGVVPELASREHIRTIEDVVKRALEDSKKDLSDIDIISATYGPGLIGSLLVGYTFAKSIAVKFNKFFFPANHILAHLFSPFIDNGFIEDEFLGLVISGGHTKLFKIKERKIELIGDTLDDACGEAFDKVAKLLGIGWPGGQEIERWAENGDPEYFKFPVTSLKGLNFSFSGLKTAVLYTYNKLSQKEKIYRIKDIAASFMKSAIDSVLLKLEEARKITGIKKIAVSGGVSANRYLRERIKEIFDLCYFPKKGLSSDNGGMVAFLAYIFFDRKKEREYLLKNAEPTIKFKL
uniref:tRNA N6-adenosine threonylcarbamoyltransferase n=1 Tax=candidate division WOR-3 bacterium TaxID=2052148 RepID=A0A7C4UAX3_UNCW3